jgi:septal ring factor EnvC (AmiA/AmiB activator)
MNNKTVKKQPTSPRPVNRDRYHASNRLQAAALIGNPLHSIFPSGNRSQSRNNRLLTNVTEIKDGSKRLHEKLEQMQRVSKFQCDELHEKLKQIHGKELDRLRVLLKKCNKEKEEKDKIIKKLNKDLEDCKREKEEKDETISRHESIIARYQTFYKKK